MCPFRHVETVDERSVESDVDDIILGGNCVAVPFAWLFDTAFSCRESAECCSALPGGRRFGPLLGIVVGYLYFD